jgi:hypothetical protein
MAQLTQEYAKWAPKLGVAVHPTLSHRDTSN